jgi:hypothetical protein
LCGKIFQLLILAIYRWIVINTLKWAYHGFTELSKEEKVNTYGNTLIRNAFDWPDYVLVDTHFSLAGAYLFAQLVEFMDKYRERVRTRHIFLFVLSYQVSL